MVSKLEKALILDLAAQKITLEHFYHRYPWNIKDDRNYVLRMLEAAADSKNAEAVEFMTYLRGFRQETEPPATHREIFQRLLLEDWHKCHEFIVDALEVLHNVASIPALQQRAMGTVAELASLDNESLRKRCVYAIAKIGGDPAIIALASLAKHGGRGVREVAMRKLKRLSTSE